ncbi:hypothetical protein ES332_A10G222800v1 [Gossypium tomentosum]|uniref:Uncharacterized protein n=1 Tax=Gossypium tomentosum TaxID=34277 RepID=A0A5D2NTB7_GOSTO|nr:hypothetical protein ES332_A10G222800v1 [Gossypium tomentosum]
MRLHPSWLMAREQRKREASLGSISTPEKGSPMVETASCVRSTKAGGHFGASVPGELTFERSAR